jgi:outer membrane protein TolC
VPGCCDDTQHLQTGAAYPGPDMNNLNSLMLNGISKIGPDLRWMLARIAPAVLLLLVAMRINAQAPTPPPGQAPTPATAPATATASAQTPTKLPMDLTLRQALDIALMNSTNLRSAQAELEQAGGRYESGKGTLLPQIGIFARQGYQTVNTQGFGLDIPGQPAKIGPFGSMDARLVLEQDLLNIANFRSSKSYSTRRDSSRLRVEDAREVVTLNVVGAYLQAMRAKATRNTPIDQTKLANDLYQITSDRFKQGVSSELDQNRSQQQVNSLEQQRQEAEYAYIAAKLTLANIIGAGISSDFEVSDQTAYGSDETVEAQATIQAALAQRPDYRAAQAAVRAAELEVKSIEATRLPTLKMRLSDGQSGNSPVHNVNVYNLMGVLEVPLFTSGRISGEVHEAQGKLSDANASLDKSRAQIETDALSAVSGVEWALREVKTSAENVGLSRREVEMSRERFVQGISDNTEVVNAQDRLTRADDASIRAQYTLGLARANLARATGGAERGYRK